MDSDLGELASAAASIAAIAPDPHLAAEAGRLAQRLATGRFYVSVLGEFKRGKSTLINALIGRPVLPTGVVPVTAVSTELRYGSGASRGCTAVHLDGSTEAIPLDRLADYVSEERNPANERRIARVEVRTDAELLRPGVVIVDTPGIGSVLRHDEEAARALLDADGAILVLSADAPLSEAERRLIAALAGRRAPTFFVLNRVDHLTPAESDEVCRFVLGAATTELGTTPRLWRVSARGAVAEPGGQVVGGLPGARAPDPAGVEFGEFAAAFQRFVDNDLVRARLETARTELAALARRLEDALQIEAATSALDTAQLAERVHRLGLAAESERRAFENGRTLLRRDVARLDVSIGEALDRFVRGERSRCDGALVELAATTPLGLLDDELRARVESEVRASFERFRSTEARRCEEAWSGLAERFRGRTQERVNAVREAAADIFDVKLPEAAIPRVADEQERFFYLFLHVGSSNDELHRLVLRLLPSSVRRRHLLERARRELASELDKHAGRARVDLTERLDSARRRFELAMAGELERSIDTILRAAARAQELQLLARAERDEHDRASNAAMNTARAALALAAGAR